MTLTIGPEAPLSPELSGLFAAHAAAMFSDTPSESCHMLGAAELAAPGIFLFVMRDGGLPIGIGAIKRLDAHHAEIKSMHVLAARRGEGLSRRLLDHLVAEARERGFSRLSLETGSQPGFLAARRLYETGGFSVCPPFAGYREDPLSLFMTRSLA